jgi:class 3 adenylate cyclase
LPDAPSPGTGWLPFRVTLLTVVVGLLVVTCVFLAIFALQRNQQNIAHLESEYLDEVADSTEREVSRLPRIAAHVLRVQLHHLASGVVSADSPIALARMFAGALQGDRMIKWVSYSEDRTGRDFLGDAVFAVFGAPRKAADHAEQAVACGIEIQRAREARNQETRERGWPRLEMGIGVDTGAAVVGNTGSVRRIKYGVVGHVVNSAARIESLTVGGQMLVSEATRAALGDRLVVQGPFEAEGKGLGTSMQVWQVLALRGDTDLVLPSPVSVLTTLRAPIAARIQLVLGKKIDTRPYEARVHRLGPGGAGLESDAPLAVFGPVQLHLSLSDGPGATEALDAKVISVSGPAGARTFVIRFTGLDWDTRERIAGLVTRSSG